PNGKISRLPHPVREQIHRHLLDGHRSKQIVASLNATPEVQQLLAAEFAGHPISQANLSQWKKRNHPGWLLQQAALSEASRFISESRQLANAGEGTVTDNLATFVAAQYAVASSQLGDEANPDAKWKRLRALCHDVVALRRGDQLAQRLDLKRLPVPNRDSVERAILVMDDVTEWERLSEEIRRTERHLGIVVESTSEIILSTDTAGRILSWNQSAEQISGYTPPEVEHRHFWEFCADPHRAELRLLFSERAAGKSPQRLESNLVTKSGKEVPVSWICSPMMDDQGQTIGMVAVGRNLTEGRKLEAQLLQAQKLAALGVMAGGIAHELRNPLAICSSAAQFLMEEDLKPDFRRECAQKVQQGMQRASGIIDHLLNFTRPAKRGDRVKLDLMAVLKETLALVADQAKIQNIDVQPQLPDAPVFVQGDTHLLQQVFMNLFLNAIHAMPQGGQLKVAVGAAPHHVSVQVADTGHGIPAADLGSIFDPFSAKSDGRKGTGLGLPLCYAIVRQHGGAIEVESTPGQGSTFTVRLDLSPD
ncbi:MAG TPA: ATP-binding protein, partial [Candidatus Acidoferrum sp.]|nr:ATP-binding protein [Candidatus Acidoferrum sp.]